MPIRSSAIAFTARTRQHGFTLIEALVVTAILAVVTSMAAPAFKGTIERYRFDAVREALADTISVARGEAIRTGQQVNIDAQVCDLGDWSCGWLVYVDLNANDAQDVNEPTFRRSDVAVEVRITKTNAGTPLRISRFGQSAGVVNTTFNIGARTETSANCRSLILNSAMRQRSVTGTSECPDTSP